MSNIDYRIGKLASKYLDVRLVLVMDVFLSVIASVTVMGFTYLLLRRVVNATYFSIIWLSSSLLASIIMFLAAKTYIIIIRHTTFRDILRFFAALFGKAVLMGVSLIAFTKKHTLSDVVIVMLVCDLLISMLLLLGVRMLMIAVYDIYKSRVREIQKCTRVLVYGTTEKTLSAITRFRSSPHYALVGVISPDKSLQGVKYADKAVYAFESQADLEKIAIRLSCSAVLFTRKEDVLEENDRLVKYCSEAGLKLLILPEVGDLADSHASSIRAVKIEDLLGRKEITIAMDEIRSELSAKTIMVTGAAGSIGSELCRQLAALKVERLILFDNAETPIHNLRLELEEKFPELDFVPVIGDVRAINRLDFAFRHYRPQIVFHAAAYKHVPLMEENPCEAVLVNLTGSRQVADKCIEYNVEKMVMISTDKAVNPTNIMGCSKRLAEIYVQSLGLAVENGQHPGRTKFVTTRFGNVLGSNGSVIPRFREQIEHGGPVTVTHPDITRFFMTIPEACRLVMQAAVMDTANKICVFDMGEPVKIDTLARRMIQLSGMVPDKDIKIEYTGLRPGEKLYEEVLSTTENTDPTPHGRIRIAKVRTYDYEEALKDALELHDLGSRVDIPEMVKLMKRIVPEFISKNSRFSQYDDRISE